jgi:hypothetical protein
MMALNIRTPEPNQGGKVFDVANPDRLGKIIGVGAEQSEVRFDDGAVRFIGNNHLRNVEAPLVVEDDRLSGTTDTLRRGQEAWHRLKKGSTFGDWKQVGAAHVLGRTAAMREAHVNKPEGRNYSAAFGRWQKQYGFEDLDKAARSRLFEMMDHLAAIEAWRATLTVTQRLDLNHPNSVVRRWKAATAKPKEANEHKVSPVQKLKDELVNLQEANDRMKREIERGGGDLWAPEDRPRDIAKIIVGKLTKAKAEKVAREILAAVKGANK